MYHAPNVVSSPVTKVQVVLKCGNVSYKQTSKHSYHISNATETL